MKSRIAVLLGLLIVSAASVVNAAEPSAGPQPAHRTGPYILGADISWVQEDEAEGSTYDDHGKQKGHLPDTQG